VANNPNFPEDLLQAYRDTICNVQNIVESYLRYLSERTDFRPVPESVRVRLEENDWTFNAYAEKANHGYIIGINAGVIIELLKPITAVLGLGCIPEVIDRGGLARSLANTAIEFLIFHELGHIALAHLDYLERTEWNELDAERTHQSGLDQVAIELMADEFAVAALANRYFSPGYATLSGIPEFSDPVVYGNALVLAIGLLFLVMTARKRFNSFIATTHPHPEMRLAIVFALLYQGRSAPDPNVSRRAISNLARLPAILHIPTDSFVGVYWCDHPQRKVDVGAFNMSKMMFEQSAAAVKQMRRKIDLFRKNLV
jgi:hypothetical protein